MKVLLYPMMVNYGLNFTGEIKLSKVKAYPVKKWLWYARLEARPIPLMEKREKRQDVKIKEINLF